MNLRFGAILLSILFIIGCKSEPQPKEKTDAELRLDSIEQVNNQSIIDSGNRFTKAYVDLEDKNFVLWADIKMDHRFYGYEKPDLTSKKLILFSIFTNDVSGNPFGLPLGAHYSTADIEDASFTFKGEEEGFVEVEFKDSKGKTNTLYFERKWVVIGDEDVNPDDDYDPDVPDDAIRDYGMVEKYQDGAYPMYIVTIDFVEKNFTMDFNLNIEAVAIDSETLSNLVGKYVSFYYTSEWVEDINDLYFEDKSLSGQYAPELDKEWSVFIGTLSGAESLSGDLPSLITITNAAGESMNFEWYVDNEVQKVNGKEVTAYYSGRAINTIVEMNPSLD